MGHEPPQSRRRSTGWVSRLRVGAAVAVAGSLTAALVWLSFPAAPALAGARGAAPTASTCPPPPPYCAPTSVTTTPNTTTPTTTTPTTTTATTTPGASTAPATTSPPSAVPVTGGGATGSAAGNAPAGGHLVSANPVRRASAGPAPQGLAFTGANDVLLVLAALLLVGGGGRLVVYSRRRQVWVTGPPNRRHIRVRASASAHRSRRGRR